MKQIRDKVRKGAEVRVGFLENATYPDGTKVATVAALNNFGAPGAGIPARPFFSNMIARQSPDWGERFATILVGADYEADAALGFMGDDIAGQLRQEIIETDSPANSPVTNLLKQRFPMGDGMEMDDVLQARADVAAGATAPAGKVLSWSGNMLASVDREVK
ncbi:MAG TPA: hypothetical protein PLM58_09200 [Novosphingobium sp.]|nr:hypothetical protein [Novosphingobium sp.]